MSRASSLGKSRDIIVIHCGERGATEYVLEVVALLISHIVLRVC